MSAGFAIRDTEKGLKMACDCDVDGRTRRSLHAALSRFVVSWSVLFAETPRYGSPESRWTNHISNSITTLVARCEGLLLIVASGDADNAVSDAMLAVHTALP